MRIAQKLALLCAALVLPLGCAPKSPIEPAQKPAARAPEKKSILPPPEPGVPAEPSKTPEPPPPPPPRERKPPPSEPGSGVGAKEVFPNIRVDTSKRTVEFDGIVPIDAHDPRAPQVFLEVVCCTPDSKEHESIVMTRARPSQVHAALLLIGLKPGATGHWDMEGDALRPVQPTGDPVKITISYLDAAGHELSFTPEEMIVDSKTGALFGKTVPARWLFAGSQFVTRNGKEWYDADGAGTLIGLCTFSSETIAWGRVISPDSTVEEPEWIARKETVPGAGTAVTVRITPG